MLNTILIELYTRDLNKLRSEINAYPSDASLWIIKDGISNSGGNLALHLCGNLLHFMGAILNNSGYIRKRDEEFSTKGTSRAELTEQIDIVIKEVIATLAAQTDDKMEKLYPLEVFGEPITTGYFLVHLSTHLNYHLGQVNYHRRLLNNQ